MKRIQIIIAASVIANILAGCNKPESTTAKADATNMVMSNGTSATPTTISQQKDSPSVSSNAAPAAPAAIKFDATGSWNLKAGISDGGKGMDYSIYPMVLKQIEIKITGTMTGNGPVKGSIDGTNVTLTITAATMGGMDIVYDGHFENADTMKGSVRVPDGRSGSWYAKRNIGPQ